MLVASKKHFMVLNRLLELVILDWMSFCSTMGFVVPKLTQISLSGFIIYLFVYVDDMILTGNNSVFISRFVHDLVLKWFRRKLECFWLSKNTSRHYLISQKFLVWNQFQNYWPPTQISLSLIVLRYNRSLSIGKSLEDYISLLHSAIYCFLCQQTCSIHTQTHWHLLGLSQMPPTVFERNTALWFVSFASCFFGCWLSLWQR